MPEGVGGDASDVRRVADRLVEQSCLPHIVPHHILNDPDPDGSTAPGEGGVVRPRAIGPRAAGPTKEGMMVMGRSCVSGLIRLVPLIVKIEIGRQWGHDPRFEDDRFARHVVAFPMNLQEMVPLLEVQVPSLRASQFDAAQTHGTPEDRQRVVSEGQFLLLPRGSTSGDDL